MLDPILYAVGKGLYVRVSPTGNGEFFPQGLPHWPHPIWLPYLQASPKNIHPQGQNGIEPIPLAPNPAIPCGDIALELLFALPSYLQTISCLSLTPDMPWFEERNQHF